MPVDGARNAAGEAGLNLAVGDAVYDETAPKDRVATQDPEAQASVSAGGLVTVTLSLGPEPQPTAPIVAPAQQAPTGPPPAAPPGKGKKNGDDKGKGKDGR
jgi:beta-lactam-binding protein with PASTA domain